MAFDVDFNGSSNSFDIEYETSDPINATFGNVSSIVVINAYEVAVANGFVGTVTEWLESLKGKDGYTPVKGIDYTDGRDGYTPVKGVDYFDGEPGQEGYTPVKGVDYFDGKDGTNGVDGYTPIKGVDYFDGKDGRDGRDGVDGKDGYTPRKGVDYFDGQDGYSPIKGLDYEDGYTPIKGVDYNDGYTPVKGVDYNDGVDGVDGTDGLDALEISTITSYPSTVGSTFTILRSRMNRDPRVGDMSFMYSIDGYLLGVEVTEVTSSKNANVRVNFSTYIKGAKGDKGDKGDDGQSIKGDKGDDGYSPVKGVDYFTEADIESLNIPADGNLAYNMSSGFSGADGYTNANTLATYMNLMAQELAKKADKGDPTLVTADIHEKFEGLADTSMSATEIQSIIVEGGTVALKLNLIGDDGEYESEYTIPYHRTYSHNEGCSIIFLGTVETNWGTNSHEPYIVSAVVDDRSSVIYQFYPQSEVSFSVWTDGSDHGTVSDTRFSSSDLKAMYNLGAKVTMYFDGDTLLPLKKVNNWDGSVVFSDFIYNEYSPESDIQYINAKISGNTLTYYKANVKGGGDSSEYVEVSVTDGVGTSTVSASEICSSVWNEGKKVTCGLTDRKDGEDIGYYDLPLLNVKRIDEENATVTFGGVEVNSISGTPKFVYVTINNNAVTATISELGENTPPIASKSFHNIIASANDANSGTFYYAKVIPNDFYTPCRVKIRYVARINEEMTHADKDKYKALYQIEFVLSGSSRNRYENYNAIYSTSYKPIYYHSLYKATQAGFDKGCPHYLGVYLASSNGATTSTLKRDFDFDIIETENCTVEFLDEMVKYTAFYNSTDYTARGDYNAYGNGNYHTGDQNTIDRLCYASHTPKAINAPMYGTQVVLSADGERFFSITNARSTSLTASTKSVNQYGFRPEHILYYSGSATISVGNKTPTSTIYESVPFTATYSYKGKALTANAPVYLVATYDEETDLFTLVSSNWMTCDEPTTEDGLYYIMLGYSYNTTALYLKPDHIIRKYSNGAFRRVHL